VPEPVSELIGRDLEPNEILDLSAFHRTATPPPQNPNYSDLAALGSKIGGAVLMGHSQSFMFPERAALLDPSAVKGIISLESGYACETSFTPEERAKLARIPTLIVFGDHHADAPEPFRSRWMTSVTQCHEHQLAS
jgi:hypothetical protein